MGDQLHYEMKIHFGSVRLGESTGRWRMDAKGWWYPIMSDTIHFDGEGREVRREPCEALIGLRFDGGQAPARPWWKFWP